VNYVFKKKTKKIVQYSSTPLFFSMFSNWFPLPVQEEQQLTADRVPESPRQPLDSFEDKIWSGRIQ
jgi:hypothetical protein